ncbi:restriction endonuclease subunit S [Methanoculleus sp.]|uniref:restriction endonuclease subunit S n=1 Tax=Methanoculleus sp. TaxID=90427 RepID=UPI00261F54D1|nr:restriction endonuclease subunit S [Methanoculleus sp.]MDI6720596.1 restriction endonuclease subunit S [Methanomicrobiales archaeon]MDI6867720.1 restriction endonuclease subunit S [Methanoculleus sp.]
MSATTDEAFTIDPTKVRAWKRYPAYKDSGVEWLGEVPAEWEIKRLKHISTVNDDTLSENTSPDYRLLYVDISNVDPIEGIQNIEELTFEKSPSRARRIVRSGDVIVSTVRTYLRAITPIVDPPENLIVSTGFAVIRPNSRFDSKFAGYALRDSYFIENVVARSNGVSYPAINANELVSLEIPLPPLPEQHAIAAFLDRETARIDALIAKKQRFIELLEEKRQAVISHVVTKGLDPDAEMKDSGVEWLGEVPDHWQLSRLKFLSTLQTGLTLGKRYEGQSLVTRPYLRVVNVQEGYFDLSIITEVKIPPEDVRRYELRPGDVLMTEGGDYDKLGRGYVWEGQIPDCLHQNHIFVVRPNQSKLKPHFLAAILTSSYGKSYFTSTSQQTTNLATTNSTKLRNLPVLLPPLIEQEMIIAFIQDLSGTMQMLFTKVNAQIEKLREYRTALISAAVTGKIDVRGEGGPT